MDRIPKQFKMRVVEGTPQPYMTTIKLPQQVRKK